MTELGDFSLLFSFFLSVLVFAVLVIGFRKKDGRFIEAAYRGSDGVFVFMTMACGALVYAFVMDDFRLDYVGSYSERSLRSFPSYLSGRTRGGPGRFSCPMSSFF
jgi:cytochrome c biogenesis factor